MDLPTILISQMNTADNSTGGCGDKPNTSGVIAASNEVDSSILRELEEMHFMEM